MAFRNPIYAALALTSIAGCQTYQRQPLDLSNHVSQWETHALDIEPIQHYAASLANGSIEETPFDSSDGLSLHEAEAVALHFNRDLRRSRAQANVPLAGAEQAGWWPDPQFQAQILQFINRGDRTRFKLDGLSIDGINLGGPELTSPGFRRIEGDFIDDPIMIGASLNITIPISGRLAVEKDLRWSQYSAAWRQILVREWQLVTNLRTAWLEWSTTVERLNVSQEYITQIENIADMTQQLVSAGEMTPTEGRLLQIELARRRTSMIALQNDEQQARLALHALMGISPNAEVTLQPQLVTAAVAQQEDHRETLITNHPEIKFVESNYEAAEQQLRLEIRRQYPDLNLGPSYSLEEGFSRLGIGIGLPIPLWNRNRLAIAEAFASRESARVQAQTVVETVLTTFAQTELRLQFATQRRNALLENVAPLVEKQVEESRTLLNLGEIDVLLLRDALTGSLNTKLDLLDAALAEARAANELQQMLYPRWFTPSQAAHKESDQ